MEDKQPLLTMIERNVVILGKVGTGKRTLGNHIVGLDIFQRESALGAGNANCHYVEQLSGDTLYRILIIDIESLQTPYRNPLPYIQTRLQTIHLIVFVVAYGRYTDESHNSLMQAVQDLQPRAKPFSALVITHCEGMKEENRRDIVDEFKENHRSSQVVDFIGKGILTVGLPDMSKVSPNFQATYQNGITNDEITIRRLVKDCDHSLSVQDLPDVHYSFRRCWDSFRDRSRCCWNSFRDRLRRCWDSFCDRFHRCWDSFRDRLRSCHCSKCCLMGISIVLFPLIWLYRHLHYSSL